jgi:NADH dehydrogenase/NADH:ubiquinone oxidoreductase subunit G
MSTAREVRNFAQELRPIVDRALDDAEILKGLREAATDKGIDWSQLKALVKAQAQDARDDGERVEKLIRKAEFASAYADMLGANVNENNETRSSSNEPPARQAAPPPAERPALIKPLPSSEMPDLPPELDRRQQARAQ